MFKNINFALNPTQLNLHKTNKRSPFIRMPHIIYTFTCWDITIYHHNIDKKIINNALLAAI